MSISANNNISRGFAIRHLPMIACLGLALHAKPAAAREMKQACEKPSSASLYQSTWDPPFCSALSGKIQSIAQSFLGKDQSAEGAVSSKTKSQIGSFINELQSQGLVLGSKSFFGKGEAANAMSLEARSAARNHKISTGKGRHASTMTNRETVLSFPLYIGMGTTKEERKAEYTSRKFRTEQVRLHLECSETDSQKTCRVGSITLGNGNERSVCGNLNGVEVSANKKAPEDQGGSLGSVYAGTSTVAGGRSLVMPRSGDIAYADYLPPWNGPERFVQPNGTPGKVLGKYNMILGKATEFGGKGDKGVKKSETGSSSESKGTLRNATGYFCAVRADHGKGKENQKAWMGQKLLVVNPETGRSIVCTVDDWGPNPKGDAGKAFVDISPAAMTALNTPIGAPIDPSPRYRARSMGQVAVSFANPGARLGVVQ